MHEAKFFELAGSLAVEVQFIVTDEEARKLLELLKHERINVFYAQTPTRFGLTGADVSAP